jgi:hypothetical protein
MDVLMVSVMLSVFLQSNARNATTQPINSVHFGVIPPLSAISSTDFVALPETPEVIRFRQFMRINTLSRETRVVMEPQRFNDPQNEILDLLVPPAGPAAPIAHQQLVLSSRILIRAVLRFAHSLLGRQWNPPMLQDMAIIQEALGFSWTTLVQDVLLNVKLTALRTSLRVLRAFILANPGDQENINESLNFFYEYEKSAASTRLNVQDVETRMVAGKNFGHQRLWCGGARGAVQGRPMSNRLLPVAQPSTSDFDCC